MKIIYRPAGSMMSVYEALEQAKEFNTMEELLDFLVSWHENAFEKEDLVFRYYGYDKRIDWETYLICTNRYDNEDYIKKYGTPQAIGYFTFKYDEKDCNGGRKTK